MKLNEKFVIAINRELGSGGRTVGEKLAQRLNIAFFDKALIKALEEKYHLTADEIEKLKGQKHGWWADFQRMVVPFTDATRARYYQTQTGQEPEELTTDDMFKAECEILKGIASEGPCVITGRSGFFVFRQHPNHLCILIQAPMENRIARLVRKRGITEEEAQKTIKKVDKQRENYVTKYTGTSRYDTRNYDLVINMANLTEDEAVDLILSYIK